MNNGFKIEQVAGVWQLVNPYGYVLYRGTEEMCQKVLDSYKIGNLGKGRHV